MKIATRLLYACTLLSLLAHPAYAQSSVDSTLRMVESLYTAGSYSLAELEARRLLENDMLSDSLRVVSEQWVAFALVAQGKAGLAKEHFARILHRRPSHELDPILTSPKILAVFTEARAAFRDARTQQIDSSVVPKTIGPARITFRTILFPGWEQWYHGRTTVGVAFFGAGVVSLGAGIALDFLRRSARSEYLSATAPADIETTYRNYNRYHQAEIYAFVAFAAVYIASEIDVLTYDSSVSLSARAVDPTTPGGGLILTLSFR